MEKNILNSSTNQSLHNVYSKSFRVAIEGNISSGKSTLINYFKKFVDVDAYEEPVEKWRNVNGNNLLDLLYSDLYRWNFTFRSYVQLTFLQTQCIPPSNPSISVQLYERSVQSNRYCFVEQAFSNGYINTAEYDILKTWYNTMTKLVDVNLDLIVYLRTNPKTVYQRMKSRGRVEENLVPLEYIEQLHGFYESWLINNENLKIPVLVLDADSNKTSNELEQMYIKCSELILGKKKVADSST